MIFDKDIPEGLKCKCGRDKNIVHCANCGTTNVVGLSRPPHGCKQTQAERMLDGNWWKCRTCRIKFCDRERYELCSAPSYGLSLKALRAADKIKVELEKQAQQDKQAENLGKSASKKDIAQLFKEKGLI